MKKVLAGLLAMAIILSLAACGIVQNSTPTVRPAESKNASNKQDEATSKPTTPPPATEAPTTQKAPETTEPIPSETVEDTYENNPYYEVVETATFKNSIGYTIFVDKVLAKQDATISATVLAYDKDENVIGKSSDEITLTAGSYNFFRYSFESDVSDATMTVQWTVKDDSFSTGPRNGVEMVKYNRSGDDLYITFEQKVDNLGSFAKFKILYYKDDQIVDTDDGYFMVYAENLSGKGSTDVASIWVYNKDFDRIECFFEP